jgi:hypothetical protein
MSGLEAIFGLVASGAGLLSLSVQLIECATRLKKIYHAAQDAPKTIARLVSGLEIMAMALRQLEQHRQQGNPAEALLIRCIAECQLGIAEIQLLVKQMEDYMTRYTRLSGKLYAAFQQRDMKELLQNLERAKSSLELACMIYRDQVHSDMLALLQAQVLEGKASLSQQLTVLARTSTPSRAGYEEIPDTRPSSKISTESRQTNIGETLEFPDRALSGENAPASGAAFQRPIRRESSKSCCRARLRFPTWLCRRIFDFALTQTQCGWSVHLRTYNLVENAKDQLIFHYCTNGNVEGMQRLLKSSAATLFDIRFIGSYITLVEVILEACTRAYHISNSSLGSSHGGAVGSLPIPS